MNISTEEKILKDCTDDEVIKLLEIFYHAKEHSEPSALQHHKDQYAKVKREANRRGFSVSNGKVVEL
jgi:hypothetical protein